MDDPKVGKREDKMSPLEAADPRVGVRFFGEMTASLSHDLKNYLAIINENAGLLEDLVAIAGDESPVNPQKVATVAGKIRHQVQRADEMIKRLNLVGHSVDSTNTDVDIGGVLNNVVALIDRKAKMKAVIIEKRDDFESVIIKTDPFLLYQLLWCCIYSAIDMGQGTLNIDIQSSATKAVFSVGPLADDDGIEKLMNLLNRLSSPLGVDISINSDHQRMVLQFPRNDIR